MIWGIHIVGSTSDGLIWRRLLIWVFADDWATNRPILIDRLLRMILALRIIVLRSRTAIICSLISSFTTISLISLSALISCIEILPCASILRHIQSIFDAWRPLTLSVSHRKMRISVSHIRLRTLITLSRIVLLTILVFARRRTSPYCCCMLTSSCVFLPLSLCWSFLIVNLRFFRVFLSFITTVASSSVLTLHVSVYSFMIVHLVLDSWLYMLIFFWWWYSDSSSLMHDLIPCRTSCLRSCPAWCKLRHSNSLAIAIRVRSIV